MAGNFGRIARRINSRFAGKSPLKGVIFDLDMTLSYSLGANETSVLRLLDEYEYGAEARHSNFGMVCSGGSPKSVLVKLVPNLAGQTDRLENMIARLHEIAKKNVHLHRPTMLAELVPEFSTKGKLAVATNRGASAGQILQSFGIDAYFSAIITALHAPPKPNPAMLHIALERMQIRPSDAIFVGDTKEDLLCGKAAGVETLIIQWKDA